MATYVCTASATCGETFTTSDDYRRHDMRRHYYHESWLCTAAPSSTPTSPSSAPCLELFYTLSAYESHMIFMHGAIELEHADVERHHLGPNASERFWCGFCCRVVDLRGPMAEAWDERLQHLVDHFEACHAAGRPVAAYVHYCGAA